MNQKKFIREIGEDGSKKLRFNVNIIIFKKYIKIILLIYFFNYRKKVDKNFENKSLFNFVEMN